METVKTDIAKVTSCVFGGPEMDQLFVTTARLGLAAGDASQPGAGSVLRIETSTTGVPSFKFAG